MLWSVLGAALAPASLAAAEPPRRMLVMPVAALGGVSPDAADLCSQLLAAELRRHPGFSVITQDGVAAAMSVEQQRQLMNCDTAGCLSELAGALNADELVLTKLGKLGESRFVLTISRVRTRDGSSLGAASRTRTGDDENVVIRDIPSLVVELLSNRGAAAPGTSTLDVVAPPPRRDRSERIDDEEEEAAPRRSPPRRGKVKAAHAGGDKPAAASPARRMGAGLLRTGGGAGCLCTSGCGLGAALGLATALGMLGVCPRANPCMGLGMGSVLTFTYLSAWTLFVGGVVLVLLTGPWGPLLLLAGQAVSP